MAIDTGEGVRPETTAESLAKLRPAFAADGTITAGSTSQISDGACAVVLASRSEVEELGLQWLAEIGAHGVVAGPDSTRQSQPTNATPQALHREGLQADDLDLVDFNKAGGAIAPGHPLGASGARLVRYLAFELHCRRWWDRRGGAVRRRWPSRCAVVLPLVITGGAPVARTARLTEGEVS